MKAEIITIGDELLIGQTIDTNSAWIGAELSLRGFEIARITSVSDRREEILSVLGEAERRSDVILVTGGLGPTSDDITKQTLCEYFGTTLASDSRVLSMIESMLARRNMKMNDNNRRQAEVPEKCRVLLNETGTAPGMWFEKNGKVFVSMPGVPYEMKHIMTERVLPELEKRFTSQVIVHRNLMTYGMPEARLAEILEDFEKGLPDYIRLAYLPSFGVIKLRLTGKGVSRQRIEKGLREQVDLVCSIIPDLIFSTEEVSLEATIGKMLKMRNSSLATAESCTGGTIAQMLTSVAGSSDYFRGSVVAYENSVKSSVLGVPDKTIARHGAVSRETCESMAEGVKKLLSADYAIAVTGIAGPGGGTESKPVGTVWISVISPAGITSEKHLFGGERNNNIRRSSIAALSLLRKQILSCDK